MTIAKHILLAVLTLKFAVVPALADDWLTVGDKEMVRSRTSKLSGELHTIGSTGTLSHCTHMIREQEGHLGSAWGAICTLTTKSKSRSILFCDDDAMGYFALQAGVFVVTDAYVAQFMEHNCMGG